MEFYYAMSGDRVCITRYTPTGRELVVEFCAGSSDSTFPPCARRFFATERYVLYSGVGHVTFLFDRKENRHYFLSPYRSSNHFILGDTLFFRDDDSGVPLCSVYLPAIRNSLTEYRNGYWSPCWARGLEHKEVIKRGGVIGHSNGGFCAEYGESDSCCFFKANADGPVTASYILKCEPRFLSACDVTEDIIYAAVAKIDGFSDRRQIVKRIHNYRYEEDVITLEGFYYNPGSPWSNKYVDYVCATPEVIALLNRYEDEPNRVVFYSCDGEEIASFRGDYLQIFKTSVNDFLMVKEDETQWCNITTQLNFVGKFCDGAVAAVQPSV